MRPWRGRRGAARRRRSVAGDEDDSEVLVELDIHRAHVALGIVYLVDALLLLLDLLEPGATERGKSGLHLLELGGGNLIVVIILGVGEAGAKRQDEG